MTVGLALVTPVVVNNFFVYTFGGLNTVSGTSVTTIQSRILPPPTKSPTKSPTINPTKSPTINPTTYTQNPTKLPTINPTKLPTKYPTKLP
eukprot:227597_1